jgi:hypothetical protein
MSYALTLQFGTYVFPNRTFEIVNHPLSLDVPAADIPNFDGGVSLDSSLAPKTFQINGKIFSTDKGSVYNSLNIMKRALHNKGQEAAMKYRDGWQVNCRLGPQGISAIPSKQGLYEYSYDVNFFMIADEPCIKSTTVKTESGSCTNNTVGETLTNAGHYEARPIFTFVAGTWNFLNDISVINTANSNWFDYEGPLTPGQTVVIDCDAGCVLLQVGLTMVDALSYFAGDLFFGLEPGDNFLAIDGATVDYSIAWRDREYV